MTICRSLARSAGVSGLNNISHVWVVREDGNLKSEKKSDKYLPNTDVTRLRMNMGL